MLQNGLRAAVTLLHAIMANVLKNMAIGNDSAIGKHHPTPKRIFVRGVVPINDHNDVTDGFGRGPCGANLVGAKCRTIATQEADADTGDY
jgi:hypothetical protein